MMKNSSRLVKHTPQRTCVACRQVKAKRELVRLVRTSDDNIEVDTSSKRAGRGVYLCPTQQCWESGLKGNRLEYALRTSVTQEKREKLIRFGKDLLKE